MRAIACEPERDRIIQLTTGCSLIGPGSIPWEVGNAFSAMFKQNRLTLEEAQKGFAIFEEIPLRYSKESWPRGPGIALAPHRGAELFPCLHSI